MKSEIMEDRYYIECPCCDPHHLLVFDVYPLFGNDNWECDILTVDNRYDYDSIWHRMKSAFRFIVNPDKFSLNQCFLINEGNIDQLERVVKVMREKLG